MTPPPPQGQGSEADKDLDESEEDDSERGLTWFWIDVEGGFQHVGLETFEVDKSNLTAGFVPTEASGGFIGAGIGARLLFLTLGPRARIGFYENWQLFSIGGELGFRFQLGILEPHFELGGGYAALGNVGGALSGVADSVNIDGAYGRISGGLDFFLGNVLSIGAAASWEFMGLTRPGVQLGDLNQTEVESLDDAEKQALEAEGSGYGSAVSLGGKLGLHF